MFLRVNIMLFGGLQVRVCPKIGLPNIHWSCSPNASGVKSQTAIWNAHQDHILHKIDGVIPHFASSHEISQYCSNI